jgi:hypothetical protein
MAPNGPILHDPPLSNEDRRFRKKKLEEFSQVLTIQQSEEGDSEKKAGGVLLSSYYPAE